MQSRIPSKYVWLLVGQFLLIIVERIIYLLKSTRAKLVLHYTLVVLYHWGLCFQLPSSNGRSFASSPLLLMFYLLQCLYLYLSSLQLRYAFCSVCGGVCCVVCCVLCVCVCVSC
jgi:hypothetical protein